MSKLMYSELGSDWSPPNWLPGAPPPSAARLVGTVSAKTICALRDVHAGSATGLLQLTCRQWMRRTHKIALRLAGGETPQKGSTHCALQPNVGQGAWFSLWRLFAAVASVSDVSGEKVIWFAALASHRCFTFSLWITGDRRSAIVQ